MKAIAQSYIWWPNFNPEIELTGGTCEVCRAVQNTPTGAPWPTWAWQRVDMDFAVKDWVD